MRTSPAKYGLRSPHPLLDVGAADVPPARPVSPSSGQCCKRSRLRESAILRVGQGKQPVDNSINTRIQHAFSTTHKRSYKLNKCWCVSSANLSVIPAI